MSLALSSVIAFVVALGVLVTVHEFGHFWVARRFGVKVLRFSIGFGRPLLRWGGRSGGTEYVLAAIPLGGYVKMLDEREGEVRPEERHLAFNTQKVWPRIAIVCAGPLANVIMAILLYMLVYTLGITGIKPLIGEVEPGSYAAEAGFAKQDLIIDVAGHPVSTWQQVRLETLDALMGHDDFAVRVKTADGKEQNRILNVHNAGLLKLEGDIIDNLGLRPWLPQIEPVLGKLTPGAAAERAGLETGDRILRANGQNVESWGNWVQIIRNSPNQKVRLLVQRGDAQLELSVVPDKVEAEGQNIGRIGALPLTRDDTEMQDVRVLIRYSVPASFIKAVEKTLNMARLSFEMIGELITGNASAKNISGPITIAEYAGRSFDVSFQYYLDFIAFISISLAVLNILPVPLLDGGHLLYYLIELVKGSPVSESVEAIGQRIGIALLACLMTLALFNDLTRLLS